MARARVLLLLALAACGKHEADDTQNAATDVRAQTARAVEAAFTEEISAIGTVSPRPGRYAELAAPAPTRVARILVTPGQWVHAGDTLIVFERAPFDAAARSAEAGLATAQHAAERADRLVKAAFCPARKRTRPRRRSPTRRPPRSPRAATRSWLRSSPPSTAW